MKTVGKLGLIAATLTLAASMSYAATTADILFVVDESGSMGGEHAWIGNMVSALDSALAAKGVTGNQYGLVGYGASGHGTSQQAHPHDSFPYTPPDNATWGTAANLSAWAGGLVASGGTEDGYQALNYALNNYAFRSGAGLNVILITDEDRDINGYPAGSYAQILALLKSKNALLNVVNDYNKLTTATGATALGHDSKSPQNAYLADGSGGYTKVLAGPVTGAFGTTVADYYNLALATGGAAWDLNQLRLGGNTAVSFTKAFVDIKVEEIIIQPTPDGGSTLLLLGSGLMGLVALRRRFLS